MISSNCLTVVRRPWVLMVSCSCWSCETGAAPIRPTAAWTFCDWIASITLVGVRLRLVSLIGSSQTRIE